jgi:hypothetical protein
MELVFNISSAASRPFMLLELRIFEYFEKVDFTLNWAYMERAMAGSTKTRKYRSIFFSLMPAAKPAGFAHGQYIPDGLSYSTKVSQEQRFT